MASSPKKKSSRSSLQRSFKRGLRSGLEKIDFVGILRRLSESERGRTWLEHYQDMPDYWANQDEIIAKARDYTLAQLEKENNPHPADEVEALVGKVAGTHDPQIALWAAAGCSAALSQVFSPQDPTNPFISPDGRELAHIEQLKEYRRQGLGVVYLVNHSSHLDEFLVDCVLLNHMLGFPRFAAGDNMVVVRSMAKIFEAGAYIVQRRGASRPMLASVYNYCRTLSEVGQQQGIFLEAWHGGARSRDGTLRYPRRLLTLRGALECSGDLVVQPVAVSYETVPEDLSLSARRGPRCWVRGLGPLRLLGHMLRGPRGFTWRALAGLYGRAYVTMPQPLLLSQLKEEHAQDQGGLQLDEFVSLTAIREIARVKKVMASQLTARGISLCMREGSRDLEEAMKRELEALNEYHRLTFGQEPDLEDFIQEHSLAEVMQDGLRTLRRRGVAARWRRQNGGLPKILSEAGLSFYATHGDRRIYSPTAKENIVVVGTDDWGFALTHLVGHRMLEGKGFENASLTLFDPRPDAAAEMGVMRHPPGRFNQHRLPKNAFVTSDPPSAFRKASEVLVASPPHLLAQRVASILEHSQQPLTLLMATCGLEPESGRLPCQVASDEAAKAGRRDVAVYSLVGRANEEDLIEGKPATVILAGPAQGAKLLSSLISGPQVTLELASDPMGVQAAAILARVYALWANYLIGARLVTGADQVGLYISKAAKEAAVLAQALGAAPDTFQGPNPAWTITLTYEGLAGPCRTLGRRLGEAHKKKKKGPLAALAAKLQQSLEDDDGIKLTALQDFRLLWALAQQKNLEAPLLAQMAEVLAVNHG